MNFLINLFTSKSTNQFSCKNQNSSPAQTLIKEKKSKRPEKGWQNQEQSIGVGLININKSVIQVPIDPSQIPKTQHILLRGYQTSKQRKLQYGFLVGIINESPGRQWVFPEDVFKLNIGKNKQIQEVANLRKNCFDKLIIFWSKQVEEYSLNELIRCRQSLMFIIEEQDLLLQFILKFDQQLKCLGEFYLNENVQKIFFYIIVHQNRYIVKFQDGNQSKKYIQLMLERQLSLQINDIQLNLLLHKITLNEYSILRKQPLSIANKIKKYLSSIKQQHINQLSKIERRLTLECDSQNQDQEEKEQIRKQSKSSGSDMQPIYFASKKRDQYYQSKQKTIQENQNLQIYLFGIGSDEEQSEQTNQQRKNQGSYSLRKMRSKSEDLIYIPDSCLELDDEFFSKYQ